MSRWRAYRPPSIGPNLKPEILLCHCLLDGGAYVMTQRYAHHSPESLREGVNVLDEPQPERFSTNLAQGAVLSGVARARNLASY